MIATATLEMSSSAFVAAVGLSDFVSIHCTLICLPRTPPALLIWLIRISKSWADWRSYGARMPVFAAEIPIRIEPPALPPPNAVAATRDAARATALTTPAASRRFFICAPSAGKGGSILRLPRRPLKRSRRSHSSALETEGGEVEARVLRVVDDAAEALRDELRR